MDRITVDLQAVAELLRIVKPTEAELRLRQLVSTLTPDEFSARGDEIHRALKLFLPKRRQLLQGWLDEVYPPVPPELLSPSLGDDVDLSAIEEYLRTGYADLSERHIFQWSTFYRDFLGPSFLEYVSIASSLGQADDLLWVIHRETAAHANEIFKKGYQYTKVQASMHGAAVNKSLAGLQRFLELPIELYSAATSPSTVGSHAEALRR